MKCTYPECDCPISWGGPLPVPPTVCIGEELMMEHNVKIQMATVRQLIEAAEGMLNLAILSTPTGAERNLLTEVNLDLLRMKSTLDKVK